MKSFFRPPIFFVLLVCAIGCTPDSKKTVLPNAAKAQAVKKGYDLEVKAVEFEGQGRADSAFAYYWKAKEQFVRATDSMRTGHALLSMANILRNYNDYTEMQALDIEALKVMGRDTRYHATIHVDLGISYMYQHDFENAIRHYREAMRFAAAPADSLTMVNNIAYVEMERGDFKKAEQLLASASKSDSLPKNKKTEARVLDNLGYCRFRLGSDGLKFMERGLFLRDSTGDKLGAITSNLHLAEMYARQDRAKANRYAKDAEREASEIRASDDRLTALSFLIQNASPMEVGSFAKNYVRINDSLRIAKQKARNYFAAVKYDYRKEHEKALRSQAKNAATQLKLARQENTTLLWTIVAIGLAVVAVVVNNRIARKNKKEKWKATYEAEVRISARLHDELANEMHQGILIAENRDLTKPEEKEKLLDLLEDAYQKTRSISRENAPISIGTGFSKRLRELVGHYMTADCNVVVDGLDSVKWDELGEAQKVAAHRLVQELLVNMKKHSGCSLAVLRFGISGKCIFIDYSDNGRGTPTESIEHKNGLAIMENRIRVLKGTVTFDSTAGKGFRAHAEIPM